MSNQSGSLLDNIIKGIFGTSYRLGGLTVGTLLIPFVRRTKRLWPTIVATESRFSSLSFLTSWTFLTFSLMTNAYISIPSAFLIKKTSYPVLHIIIVTFGFVTIVDLLLRLCCSFISSPVRRRLYEPMLRLGLGVISFGAAVDALLYLGGGWGASLAQIRFFPLFDRPIAYVSLLSPFAAPLAIITIKVLKPRFRWQAFADICCCNFFSSCCSHQSWVPILS
jgi:hypothetical protein